MAMQNSDSMEGGCESGGKAAFGGQAPAKSAKGKLLPAVFALIQQLCIAQTDAWMDGIVYQLVG